MNPNRQTSWLTSNPLTDRRFLQTPSSQRIRQRTRVRSLCCGLEKRCGRRPAKRKLSPAFSVHAGLSTTSCRMPSSIASDDSVVICGRNLSVDQGRNPGIEGIGQGCQHAQRWQGQPALDLAQKTNRHFARSAKTSSDRFLVRRNARRRRPTAWSRPLRSSDCRAVRFMD